ncbi:MAG: glycerol kinase GlpK [Oscillospiraceae bacterium]|nr:glycerol kinase GlpK [Oscillospiraceae bacterium]
MKYVMSLDQGTTSSRCIIFDINGKIVSCAQKEFRQIYPKSGWVEHNPDEIYSSQVSVAAEALALMGATAQDIECIGITNQRETTILWDKNTGEPIYNAIVWQCRRTSDYIEKIKADNMSNVITDKTGLVPDPYFSATKIMWILDNVEGAREKAQRGDLLFGTVDCYLIWKLTGGKVHATDCTNASRTMLYNIYKNEWDSELLEYFNIPKAILPQVKLSSDDFGTTGVLGSDIKICGVAGDQQAALFGQCCFEKGEGKNTYGTGCFLLTNTGNKPIKSKNGLVTTIACGIDGEITYALEGSVFVAGAAIQWLRDELGLISKASETEEIALSVADTNGVTVVPAFTGLGAPYWNPYARGIITGISRGTGKAHIVRSTLESLAFQSYDLITAMENDIGEKISVLKVDGGASANTFLMQFQADVLNAVVKRPSCIETTAMGAAFLAGLYCGFWKSRQEIKSLINYSNEFIPQISGEQRSSLIQRWAEAISLIK